MPEQRIDNPTDLFKQLRGRSPEEAKFFWSGGPIEVAARTWFQSVFSGVTAFETDEGLVLVDSGLLQLGPKLAGLLRQKTSAPVHTAIFTHGHVDHAFGLNAFLVPGQKPPRVIAHRAVPARFARYERTRRHNAALNARQFGGAVQEAETSEKFDNFKRPPLMPDTLYDDELTVRVGGVRFDIRHSRGETDDHSYVHCADRGVLCSGDFFIWSVPNAGNPQKVQRYPWEWANALRVMAGLAPRSLCPGHGGPVVNDPPRIARMLTETADYLDAIVAQTIAALEDGSPPHVDIVRAVEPPRSSSPWLQPVYDEAEFIVRNVIRYYGGWWSGRPSELKPAPRQDVAHEMARLAGGAAALLARAQAVAADGDLRLACHVADYALEAEPADPDVQRAVAALYEQRAAAEPGLMARNLFRSAAAYARAGRPFR
jgi:glyoxylase-like metal-dependent hydrolase (beta-lactamase superfamily II)